MSSANNNNMQHQNLNFRGLGVGDRNSFFSREIPFTDPGNFHQLESMWLIDGEQKNFPYILDWYYTSQNHDREDNLRDTPSRNQDYDEENPRDLWYPPDLARNDKRCDDSWGNDTLFEDRVQNHLEDSRSAPLFQESVLQHHESNEAGLATRRSDWWARRTPQGLGQETSFLEPPNFFNRGASSRNYYDNLSERSEEEDHRQQLDLRNSRGLSKTFFMDDGDGADFDLPFVDAYCASPPENMAHDDEDPLDLV